LVKTKDRPTVGNLKMAELSANLAAFLIFFPFSPMNNPWIKRFAVLAIMFGFYGIGIAAGRDQATLAHYNHPACHPNLKP